MAWIEDLYRDKDINQVSDDFWSLTDDQKSTAYVSLPGNMKAEKVVFHDGKWCSISYNQWSDIPHYSELSRPFPKFHNVYFLDESIKEYKVWLLFPDGLQHNVYQKAKTTSEALNKIIRDYPDCTVVRYADGDLIKQI